MTNTKEVEDAIKKASAISIIAHKNPDADTIATALGIYAIVKREFKKPIELACISKELPYYLDFLPNFKKIKHHLDYEHSLVITCDCADVKRAGFELKNRDIINIDHHDSNTYFGTINVVKKEYASTSQVAYELFCGLYEIDKAVATSFYTALFSDTQGFSTSECNSHTLKVAYELSKVGCDIYEVAYNLTMRRSLCSIRALQRALKSLTLHNDAKVAVMSLTKSDLSATGANMVDIDGIVEYGRSLSTVDISIFALETQDGVKVSLRSKSSNVAKLAKEFGGGGHTFAAGFEKKDTKVNEIIGTILTKIDRRVV